MVVKVSVPLSFLAADSFIHSGMQEFSVLSGRVGRLRSWLWKKSGRPLGRWGEWVALRYLLGHNFDVVARNWTSRRGELDIIAFHQGVLVFVEVKTRRGPSLLPPEFTITGRKERQLEDLAYRFLSRYELEKAPFRFDLIAIEAQEKCRFELRHYRSFI